MATAIKPATRPEATREGVLTWTEGYRLKPPFLVGRRGYYRDSMGVPGKNDIDIYDDAIFLVLPNGMKSYNANTDPSKLYPKVAVLKPGLWHYRVGTHNITKEKSRRYEALVQADRVTVARHGAGDDTGWFGINIHKGSRTTTSSAGCQTIHPDQWEAFMKDVKKAMADAKIQTIPYLLVDRGDL